MLVPKLGAQFFTALLHTVILFAMVVETSQEQRFLEAMAVFILFWASIVSYAWAHMTATKTP